MKEDLSSLKRSSIHQYFTGFPFFTHIPAQPEGKRLAVIRRGLKVTHGGVNLPCFLIYVFLKCGQHPDGKFSNGER